MDVSIIIVNYNTSKLINACIASIFEKVVGIDYEIIIVDNFSENLSNVIEASADPRIKLLQLPKNIGFGRANNSGAKIAVGRNIFLLNPDTLLLNNAVKILSDFLDTHPTCGVCGGNLFDKNLQPTYSYRHFLPGLRWELNDLLLYIPERIRYGSNRIFNNSQRCRKVGYITGADLMIPYKIFKYLGGFSSEFFMYFEETDLCARIRKLKLEIISVPFAKIVHLEGASFPDPNNLYRLKMIEEGRLKFLKRNVSKIEYALSNIVYKASLRFMRFYVTSDSVKILYLNKLALVKDFLKRKEY